MSPSSFEPTWESLKGYRVPRWFEQAKLGIFIHWGIYSVPAYDNEWYSRNMYLEGTPAFTHHRETYGPQDVFGYKDFIPMLTGSQFDPDAWLRLFKRTGARYIVSVAQHHDGFAMFDSARNPWNAAVMGPKRDVLRELKSAADAHGLRFGVSNHHAENWWFFDGGRKFSSDVQNPANSGLYGPAAPSPSEYGFSSPEWNSLDWQPRPTEAFLEDWYARCVEQVEAFAPNLFYFDSWIQQKAFAPYLQKFAAYYYNRIGPDAVLTYKHGAFPDGTAVYDVERGKLIDIRTPYWQTDTSLGYKSWAYLQDEEYRTAESLVHLLVDIVSKNGNLLINVGPKADGSIPPESTVLLESLGAWLDVNAEAIYDTHVWHRFGEGDTPQVEGHMREREEKPFTASDIRFTVGENALYAIALGWPDSAAHIHSLGSAAGFDVLRIAQIEMLGDGSPLLWTQHADGLRIETPAAPPCEHAYTFKITMK